jgi:hypothetical protein
MPQYSIEDLRNRLRRVTDGLGAPIDEGILDTVVAMNAVGLRTSQSCQGHRNGRGTLYPWVEVAPEEPAQPAWWDDDDLSRAMGQSLSRLYLRATELLTEFYQSHPASFEKMLGFSRVGWGFRIQSHGTEPLDCLERVEQLARADQYVDEMQAFTKFLLDQVKRGEDVLE